MGKYLAIMAAMLVFALQPAHAAMHMLGEDDADKQIEAQMQPDWKTCHESKDCAVIHYGCSSVMAANKQHVSEAEKLGYQIGGDPRTLNCSGGPMPTYVGSCMNNQCYATNPTE